MAKGGGGFWSSIPGVMTGLAGILTAVVGLLTLAYNLGWIGDGDEDEPATGGGGSVPSFSVEPGSLSFSPVDEAKDVTVENTGTGPVSFEEPQIEGDDAFAVGDDDCAGTELPSGRTCTLEVTFDPPTGPGRYEATLVISTGGGERSEEVELEGTGVL